MELENTYNNIEEVLSNIPENYKIMEEIIDLEIQKDYFESAKNLILDPDTDTLNNLIKNLNNDQTPVDTLKIILMKLALIDAVEAFRAIETYHKQPHPDIKDWSLLSLQQSRMVIQSSLLGEQQVFISTGLGGKENKLRYLLIFPYNNRAKLSAVQKKAIKSELNFFVVRNMGIIEEIEIYKYYTAAMVLLPIKANIPDIIKEILEECNHFENFLTNNVMITNMKKFSHDEIIKIIHTDDKK